MSKLSSSNYSTYYLTPIGEELRQCEAICLRNETEIQGFNQMENHWKEILRSGEQLFTIPAESRDETSITFTTTEFLETGYNIIYYYLGVEKKLLAYTVLNSVQDLTGIGKLTIKFLLDNQQVSEGSDLIIINSLATEGYLDDPNQQTVESESDYPKISNLSDIKLDSYSRFTSDIKGLTNEKVMITDCTTFYSGDAWKNNILLSGVEIGDWDYKFIGIYNGKPSMYLFSSEGEFRVISLLESTYFGYPIEYKAGAFNQTLREISHVANQYIFFKSGEILNIDTGKLLNGPFGVYPDLWGIDKYLKEFLGQSEFTLDISGLIPKYKVGDWYVFSGSNTYDEYYVSISGSIYFDLRFDRPMVLNNRCIISETTEPGLFGGSEKTLTFYTPDNGECLESISLIDESKKIDSKGRLIRVAPGLSNHIIPVPIRYGAIVEPGLIDGVRHRPLSGYNLPQDIIGTYRGFIFYGTSKFYIL